MKYVIPMMMEKKHGAILNVSSTTGLTGKENRLAYGASKSGLIFLTKAGPRVRAIWRACELHLSRHY